MEPPIPDKVSSLFRLLGIGRREIRVYFTVLTHGPLTARDIALYLNISPTKVYEPLNKLVELGLVTKTGDRPARFIAVEPRIAWHRVRGMVEESIRVFEERLLPKIEALYRGGSGLYRIILVPGNKVLDRLVDVIASSSRNIDMALAYRELLTKQLFEAIRSAAKHVRIRMLIGPEHSRLPEIVELGGEGINIRILEGMFGSGAIGSSVILIVKTREDELIGMWSDHEFFVEVAKVYFEHLWGKSIGLTSH